MLVNMEGDPNALILRAPHDAFDILPGHVKMGQAEGKLGLERNREWRLARVLKAIDKPCDFILVDCPPWDGRGQRQCFARLPARPGAGRDARGLHAVHQRGHDAAALGLGASSRWQWI